MALFWRGFGGVGVVWGCFKVLFGRFGPFWGYSGVFGSALACFGGVFGVFFGALWGAFGGLLGSGGPNHLKPLVFLFSEMFLVSWLMKLLPSMNQPFDASLIETYLWKHSPRQISRIIFSLVLKVFLFLKMSRWFRSCQARI